MAGRVADDATLSELNSLKQPQELDRTTFLDNMWLRSAGSSNIPQWPAFKRYRDGKNRILAKSVKGFQERHAAPLSALRLLQQSTRVVLSRAVVQQAQAAINAELTQVCTGMALAEAVNLGPFRHLISEISDCDTM